MKAPGHPVPMSVAHVEAALAAVDAPDTTDDVLRTRKVVVQSSAAHLWVTLEQDEDHPESLHLDIESSAFNACSVIASERGFGCEIHDARALLALGEAMVKLANVATDRGMFTALHVQNNTEHAAMWRHMADVDGASDAPPHSAFAPDPAVHSHSRSPATGARRA